VIDAISDRIPHFFMVSSNTDEIILSVHQTYAEHRRAVDQIVEIYRTENLLIDDPSILLFPIGETKVIKDHNYSGVTKRDWGIEDEFGDKLSEFISARLSNVGWALVQDKLEGLGLTKDDLSTEDLPSVVGAVREIAVPMLGKRNAEELVKELSNFCRKQKRIRKRSARRRKITKPST
jgi:hypothetical protein